MSSIKSDLNRSDRMSIISNTIYPPAILNIGGDYATIILTILLSLSFLLSETRYFNKFTLNMLDSNSKALLMIFIAVAIFKILIIISEK